MSAAALYTVENQTPADYAAAREANPAAVIPATGEPWVIDERGAGLKVYARDESGQTCWLYVAGDRFVSDAPTGT
jgi:hypothetical protein